MKDFEPQIPPDTYYEGYDKLGRFISYYYQTHIPIELKPQSILEIGIGNKTVSNYLRQAGYNVTTCDIDKNLRPDYIADIRELPFENNSFDAVLAYEILEHLNWEDVDKALSEIHRVAKRFAVISVPYDSIYFEIIIRFPFISRFFKKPFFDIFLRVPVFFLKHKFDGQHHWSMGKKGYSIRKIRNKLRKSFNILKEVRPELKPYHYSVVLQKKNNLAGLRAIVNFLCFYQAISS